MKGTLLVLLRRHENGMNERHFISVSSTSPESGISFLVVWCLAPSFGPKIQLLREHLLWCDPARMPVFPQLTEPQKILVGSVTVGAATLLSVALIRYRSAIRSRLQALQESTFFGSSQDPFRMVRVDKNAMRTDSELHKKVKLVALNPDFQARHKDWKMMSLGDYMSSLRPALAIDQKMPEWIESEIQASLSAALLTALGPQLGAAVLPGLGAGIIDRTIGRVSGTAAAYLASAGAVDRSVKDQGGLPLSLFAMTYVAEVNYKRLKNKEPDPKDASPSPLELLRHGEAGFKPSFNGTKAEKDPSTAANVLVPNPFVVSKHWDRAIEGLEEQMNSSRESQGQATQAETDGGSARPVHKYSPDSKAMGTPKAVHERLLPDLHIGWGSAQCTHTHRQILKNRLLAILLNRLASNYYFLSQSPFVVQMEESGKAISKPGDLIQALFDRGHSVETCVRTHNTTFGVALCVKENDASWTNVPLAIFMENGYVDAEGNEAYTCLSHSGLNLEIRGPLFEKGSLQHYMAIEGLCGWHSNHNGDVPWVREVDCGEVMHGEKAVDSVSVAALEAVIINGVGTKFHLPFGGYGLTGVCNDTAGLLEYALSGKTHVYPLTFNGRFSMHNLRFARELKKNLQRTGSMSEGTRALDRLIAAMMALESDVNSLPSEALGQCKRQLHCMHPELPFALIRDSKDVLESIQSELLSDS